MKPLNRHARRRVQVLARKPGSYAQGPSQLIVPKDLKPGIQWEQMVDPEDDGFILIEARIPRGGFNNGSFEGQEAFMQMFKFCSGFMKAFTK